MTTALPVLFELVDGVATISLNRPDRLNALTREMLDELRRALERAVREGARSVLLLGEGRGFCSGAELGSTDPAELGAGLEALLERHYNPVARALAELPIPIVSGVRGPVAGAGVSLALAADIVVAAQSAYLLLAFSNIGLVPDAGATWLVAKSAGRARTLELALLGERMNSQEALNAGLITRVVADEDLDRTARAFAQQLARKPTRALGLIRGQVSAALAGTLAETLEVEARHQGIAGRTEDFAEGVRAFVEKRAPSFEGR